jgi:hypothetical protein
MRRHEPSWSADDERARGFSIASLLEINMSYLVESHGAVHAVEIGELPDVAAQHAPVET